MHPHPQGSEESPSKQRSREGLLGSLSLEFMVSISPGGIPGSDIPTDHLFLNPNRQNTVMGSLSSWDKPGTFTTPNI